MIGYDRIIKTALALLALIAAATVVSGQVRAQDVSSGKEYLSSAAGGLDRSRSRSHPVLATSQAAVTGRRNVSIVGSRPHGCPHRYCGCASARYVNLPNRHGRWNLARNWFALPSASPGPGMADVRRHHVRIIIAAAGNGLWKFFDPNSGRGLTRIHVDRIRGRVVNPHGVRIAARGRP